jgi:4-amino-4-deoxy-L-arabinose transferase-like glycosyltransferase
MKLNPWSLGIFLLLIFIVLIKISHLSLPYFWDEAWSYGPAVHYMHEHGLGLLPNSLPMEFSRGHPLLFYFISAFAMKIFGSGLIGSHIFPLLISLSVVVSLFLFARYFFNKEIAFFSALFFSCQALFLAQANFILPDMFLVLCTIIALYGYLKPNGLIYFAGASAFLFVKETGIILILFLFVWEVIQFFRQPGKNFNSFLRRAFLIFSPLPAIIIFFIIQKIRIGWFFYPEHIYSIEPFADLILQKFTGYMEIVFISHAKYIVLAFSFSCLILLIKKSFFKNNLKISELFFFLIFFSLFYLLCMSFLFFNLRYALTVLPFVSIILCSLIYYSFNRRSIVRRFILVLLIIPVGYNAYSKRTSDNETLGYIDVIKSNKAAADYLVNNNYSDSVIYVPFVMGINLDSTLPGYISSEDKVFKNLVYKDVKGTQLFIFVDSRPKEEMEILIKKYNLTLLKEFRSGIAWTAIYKPSQKIL